MKKQTMIEFTGGGGAQPLRGKTLLQIFEVSESAR